MSPTECVIFAPGRSNGLGMSFDDSIQYCHTLSGMHTWVGNAIQVTALQRTIKEGRYDVNRAKEFTHERTKQRLAQLHSATPTTPSPAGSPKHPTHPAMETPRGHGMTRRTDRQYVQETIKNMQNLSLDDRLVRDEPRQRTSTPDAGQYDSADQEQDMEEDDVAAELDFDSEDYDTEATGNLERSTMVEHRRRRNHAMRQERARAKRGFKRGGPPRRGNLIFSMFRGNDRDDCISYRDWRAEIESAMARESSLPCSKP